MNNLLQGKRGIIFGALDENSIAWKVALKAHQQGAKFILSNAPVALRMGEINKLAAACNTTVIAADATSVEDLEKLIQQSTEQLGGKLDFILHSIGMSPNVRKGKTYTDVNYEWFQKTLDISALSLHKMLQVCVKHDAINEWGSVVALTYIAGQRAFPGYGDMADAKATLESIVRSFGYYYGNHKKVRVNSVSQSPTMTTGLTQITFLFSANKGFAAQEIKDVASGGELSRLMLCIKSLIADAVALPTLIFDEIDSGISGEVALKVGEIMKKLSRNHQLVAITHLPQIARTADAHLYIYKETTGSRTSTRIKQLAGEERIIEIAKMLSGEKPTEAALANAREMVAE